jgi:hypothetical protein
MGSRGGCALRGVRTGANRRHVPARGGGRAHGAHLRPCAGHTALVPTGRCASCQAHVC